LEKLDGWVVERRCEMGELTAEGGSGERPAPRGFLADLSRLASTGLSNRPGSNGE